MTSDQQRATGQVSGYDPFVAPDRDDPFPTLAAARRGAGVVWCPVDQSWLVTRYPDAVRVLDDPETFSSADAFRRPGSYCPEAQAVLDQGYGADEIRPLLATDPPRHRIVRRVMAAAFTPRRVAGLEPTIRALAEQLVDEFADDGHVELVARFAYPLPLTVIMALLGIPAGDQSIVKQWSDDRIALYWADLAPDTQIRCARSLVEFQSYLRKLVDDRRRRPGDDFVSDLVAARTEDGVLLDTPGIVGQLLALIAAGHETTTNLIANGVVLLLRHRSQWEALAADSGLAPGAVEEILRMDGPAKGFSRTATVDSELGSVSIPAGSRIRVMFDSANRDGTVFSDPDRFDIRRAEAKAHLGFGHGPHFCVGSALARLHGRVALEVLSRRLPGLRLPAGYRPRYRANANLRLLVDLPVEWDLPPPGGRRGPGGLRDEHGALRLSTAERGRVGRAVPGVRSTR